MSTCKILADGGIAVFEPSGPLSENDFKELTATVDRHIETHGSLRGLLIHTKAFPGWESFGGFTHHLRFVRDHHQLIERFAVVTDSILGTVGPKIGSHFLRAEIRHFPYDQYEEALAWLRHGAGN